MIWRLNSSLQESGFLAGALMNVECLVMVVVGLQVCSLLSSVILLAHLSAPLFSDIL
jgi:hypothetical protein